jgi:hypothetical protein
MTCLLIKFPNDLTVNATNHVSFSIYQKLSSNRQQKQEAEDIWWFLLSLCKLMSIEDVEYGPDPPDFIFHVSGKSIGVELTKLNPKVFVEGGYAQRKLFKEWQQETNKNPQPRSEFKWGQFTVKESLDAFAKQFEKKCKDVSDWKGILEQKWLLAHIDSGSPFGDLFTAREKISPGREEECADYKAKLIYSLSAICQKPHPFDYVILFSGPNLFPFPANGKNPHKLPFAKPEILEKGAKASDRFLHWSSSSKSCKKQLSLEEIKNGKLDPFS